MVSHKKSSQRVIPFFPHGRSFFYKESRGKKEKKQIQMRFQRTSIPHQK